MREENFWKNITIIAYGVTGKWFYCLTELEGSYSYFFIDSLPPSMKLKDAKAFIEENHLDGEGSSPVDTIGEALLELKYFILEHYEDEKEVD